MKVYMKTPSGEVFETSIPQNHPDSVNLGNSTKAYAARRDYVCEQLRDLLPPETTIHGVVRSIAKSGLSRRFSFFVVTNGSLRDITMLFGDATGRLVKDGEVSVSGCGMDMGFAAVYDLGRALYPNGFGLIGTNPAGKTTRAKSVKHAKQLQKKGFVFRGRNGDPSGWETDGGYALNHNYI